MPYDQALAEQVRELLADVPVTEKRMFGGLAFLLDGKMAVAASGQGGLLVRVDPAEADALLDEPDVAPMQMGGRAPMTGWLHVRGAPVADEASLASWVRRGVEYAASLPVKPGTRG